MRKTLHFTAALFITVLSLLLAAAQAAYNPAANNSGTAEFQAALGRTASGIALSGHGDFPMPERAEQEPAPPAGNGMPHGQLWGYLVIAYHAICSQLADSGVLPRTTAAPGFGDLSRHALDTVRNSRYAPRKAGADSLLEDPGFIREMELITGSDFAPGGSVEFLVDGPAAFAVKDRLVREAKKKIRLVTYAIYDDVTGNETVSMLLAKKKEGVDIKVIVDHKMAYIFGGRLLKLMARSGIEVLRYSDAARPHNYLHVKMLIVDDTCAVIGGMNYGDAYSHKGNGLKWRDTDVLYTGPMIAESEKIFAALWKTGGKGGRGAVNTAQNPVSRGGAARIAVLFQTPPAADPPILLSVLKAIYGATKRINIENAYIVAIPAVTQAIFDAISRGVEVHILTNSKESIDSDGKAMAETILDSAKMFADYGAHVYLKQGHTLHSKFMTVDGVFCNIGSYNLHPRSERYDMELNINLLDAASVARLDAVFARDTARAKKVTAKDLAAQKPSLLAAILKKYFFSQLSPGPFQAVDGLPVR